MATVIQGDPGDDPPREVTVANGHAPTAGPASMPLLAYERAALEHYEAARAALLRDQRAWEDGQTVVVRMIEGRLGLPAGALGTTHEIRDWAVVPDPFEAG